MNNKKTILCVLALIVVGMLTLGIWKVLPEIYPKPKPMIYLAPEWRPMKVDTIQSRVIFEPITPTTDRFFLVSYTISTDDYKEATGTSCLRTNDGRFFTKKFLDMYAFAFMPKERRCYGNLVITSIFEFKSLEDYSRYQEGLPPSGPGKWPKKCCDRLQLRGFGGEQFKLDSAITRYDSVYSGILHNIDSLKRRDTL